MLLLQYPLLWNIFYTILKNNRSRLLHVFTDNGVTSLQVVPCPYWTIAVTGTVACVYCRQFVTHLCINNGSKTFNSFTDIY